MVLVSPKPNVTLASRRFLILLVYKCANLIKIVVSSYVSTNITFKTSINKNVFKRMKHDRVRENPKMLFFMFFCDNNLETINTLDKPLQNKITELEQRIRLIESYELFTTTRVLLSEIIRDLCATQRSKDKRLLRFIGGLTMIEKNMVWNDELNRAQYTDINDAGVLI